MVKQNIVSYDELFLCLYFQRLTPHIRNKCGYLEAKINEDILLKFKEIINKK